MFTGCIAKSSCIGFLLEADLRPNYFNESRRKLESSCTGRTQILNARIIVPFLTPMLLQE